MERWTKTRSGRRETDEQTTETAPPSLGASRKQEDDEEEERRLQIDEIQTTRMSGGRALEGRRTERRRAGEVLLLSRRG